MRDEAHHHLLLTHHARVRMAQRGIPRAAVCAAFSHGRSVYVRGAEIFAIGRAEVSRARRQGLDLRRHEGVQVVCARNGAILTVYRNRDLSSLRPGPRRRPRG